MIWKAFQQEPTVQTIFSDWLSKAGTLICNKLLLTVRNFFSTSHFYFFQQTQLGLFIFIYSFIVITFLIWYKSSCLNLIVVQVTVTSEDVCWSIRNVKFLNVSFYNMRCVVMFITAVCLIFLLKLKWPKNKSVYDLV